MPEISSFYGIVISMYPGDHNPPHFHVRYNEYRAIIEIESEVVTGEMPNRALKFVFEWLDLHRMGGQLHRLAVVLARHQFLGVGGVARSRESYLSLACLECDRRGVGRCREYHPVKRRLQFLATHLRHVLSLRGYYPHQVGPAVFQ